MASKKGGRKKTRASMRLTEGERDRIEQVLRAHFDHWGGTTRELADELSVSQTTVSKTLRAGHVKPSSYDDMLGFFSLSVADALSEDPPAPTRVAQPSPRIKLKTTKPRAKVRARAASAPATSAPATSSPARAQAPAGAAAPAGQSPSGRPTYTREKVFAQVAERLGLYEPGAREELGVTDALVEGLGADGAQGEAARAGVAAAMGTSLKRIDALIAADALGPMAYAHLRQSVFEFMNTYDVSIQEMCEDAGLGLPESMRVFVLDLPERELFERVFASLGMSVKEMLGTFAPAEVAALGAAPGAAPAASPATSSAPAPAVVPALPVATPDPVVAAAREEQANALKTRAKVGAEYSARMEALGLAPEVLAAAGGVSARYVDEVMRGVASDPEMYQAVGLILQRAERDASRASARAHTLDPALASLSVGTRDMLEEVVRRTGTGLEDLLRAYAIDQLTSTERGHDMFRSRAQGEILRAPAGTSLEVLDMSSGQWTDFPKI